MKFMKFAATVLLIAFLLLIFIVNFSVVEHRLECSGTIYSSGNSGSITLYANFEKYTWWVLWGTSDGAVHLEIPHKAVEYYGYVKKIGDLYTIFESYSPPRNRVGSFSTLSNALTINTSEGHFEGSCARWKNRLGLKIC